MHGVVVTVARVFFTLQNLLLSQVCAFLLAVNLVLLFFDYQLSCFFVFFWLFAVPYAWDEPSLEPEFRIEVAHSNDYRYCDTKVFGEKEGLYYDNFMYIMATCTMVRYGHVSLVRRMCCY